jgi:hypothetical protein
MGRTAAFSIQPSGTPLPTGLAPVGDHAGWSLAGVSTAADLDALLRDLLATGGRPVLAGRIEDSDFGTLAGAGPEGSSFALVLGEPYDDSATDDVAGDPAAWCGEAGTVFDDARLLYAYEYDAVYVEERFHLALEALGVPPTLLNGI